MEGAEQVAGGLSSPTNGTLDCSQELDASLRDGHRGRGPRCNGLLLGPQPIQPQTLSFTEETVPESPLPIRAIFKSPYL